jgi:ABC-type Mn2+/Zn2+ transport system permease subunit
MVLVAAALGAAAVVAGLSLSYARDIPGGPAIVLVMAVVAVLAVVLKPQGRQA